MTLENKTKDAEYYMQLARESRVGLYKGKKGFYIGTLNRGDDSVLLGNPNDVGVLLDRVQFVIYDLGFPESKKLDLINLQQHDTIAGPFEDYQTALKVLPLVLKMRYLKE